MSFGIGALADFGGFRFATLGVAREVATEKEVYMHATELAEAVKAGTHEVLRGPDDKVRTVKACGITYQNITRWIEIIKEENV